MPECQHGNDDSCPTCRKLVKALAEEAGLKKGVEGGAKEFLHLSESREIAAFVWGQLREYEGDTKDEDRMVSIVEDALLLYSMTDG